MFHLEPANPRHHRIHTQAIEVAGKGAGDSGIYQGQHSLAETVRCPLANGWIAGKGFSPEIPKQAQLIPGAEQFRGDKLLGFLGQSDEPAMPTEIAMKILQGRALNRIHEMEIR
jgi:hypothetical protein